MVSKNASRGSLLIAALIGLAFASCSEEEVPLYIQGFGSGTKTITNGMTVDYGVQLSASPKDIEYIDIDPNSVGGWDAYVKVLTPTSKTFKFNAGDNAQKPFTLKATKVTTSPVRIPFVLRRNGSTQQLSIEVVGQNNPDAGHYEMILYEPANTDLPIPDASTKEASTKEASSTVEAGAQ